MSYLQDISFSLGATPVIYTAMNCVQLQWSTHGDELGATSVTYIAITWVQPRRGIWR